MTDKYADLRGAVNYFGSGDLNGRDWIVLANPETIRALLADYDRMREALQREAVYHEGQEKAHRVWAKNTNGVHDALKVEWHKERAQQIRAALAQEQGGGDG